MGNLGSLEHMALGMGKMQAAMEAHNSTEDAMEAPVMVLSYSEERARRVLYQDIELQLLVSTPHAILWLTRAPLCSFCPAELGCLSRCDLVILLCLFLCAMHSQGLLPSHHQHQRLASVCAKAHIMAMVSDKPMRMVAADLPRCVLLARRFWRSSWSCC